MKSQEELQDAADRAFELLERKSPHQLAVELVSMEDRLQAALDACARMQEQRDQMAAQLSAAKRCWPEKCPITRRDFFMEIDGVPTYGGPYDSYTIPEMLGTPDQPWHERELFVRRFDHDRGHWVDDEVIGLRVIHDGVLDELLADQMPEGGA